MELQDGWSWRLGECLILSNKAPKSLQRGAIGYDDSSHDPPYSFRTFLA